LNEGQFVWPHTCSKPKQQLLTHKQLAGLMLGLRAPTPAVWPTQQPFNSEQKNLLDVHAFHREILQQGMLHADETPVQTLNPSKGKTHRAYHSAYMPNQYTTLRAVVHDFAGSRAGEYPGMFSDGWHGKLVCDDYGGCKASFLQDLSEIGCAAHARRKFFELHANHSSGQPAKQPLPFFAELFDIEREAADLDADACHRRRQNRARPHSCARKWVHYRLDIYRVSPRLDLHKQQVQTKTRLRTCRIETLCAANIGNFQTFIFLSESYPNLARRAFASIDRRLLLYACDPPTIGRVHPLAILELPAIK
jgi:hypothetical protein